MSLADRLLANKDTENYLNEYGELVKLYKPIDLGLGSPNYLPSKFVTDALRGVLDTESADDHQYTSPQGHPRLRKILSKLYSHHLGKELDPEHILITAGSSEALYCAIMSLIAPEDEVIIIEPCFMVFIDLVKMAGATPKFVSLKLKEKPSESQTSADWKLNKDELEQIFTAKTKAIIMNTPHNPTGKVFSMEELSYIADLCKKWNVICIADEVYERMVFKPTTHIRIASLPDMFERTVTIGAAEKSFGVTGWQIGWAYGPSHLLQNLRLLHQYTVFNATTILQIAFAKMFEDEYNKLQKPDSYFELLEKDLREKRDYLAQILSLTKIKPILPEGGMFILANISQLVPEIDLSSEKDEFLDLKFVKWLTKNFKLQLFPVTIFCIEKSKKLNENLVRLVFVKKRETLEEAAMIIKKL